MTIGNPAGWIDWADHVPGLGNKVYAEPNAGLGIVWHSMEGWYDGSLRELMKPERQASWMFSLKLDGTLVQHYPISASCWANGNFEANTRYWSVELEGTLAMPINPGQMMTAEALIAEWEDWSGKAAVRPETLLEHREVATRWSPNAGPTACPSERYEPLWAALEGEDMTREQVLALLKEFNLIDEDETIGDQDSVASLNEWIERHYHDVKLQDVGKTGMAKADD